MCHIIIHFFQTSIVIAKQLIEQVDCCKESLLKKILVPNAQSINKTASKQHTNSTKLIKERDYIL